MRISDIFKRHGQEDEHLPKGIKPEVKPAEIKGPEESEPRPRHETSVKLSSALNKELDRDKPSTANIGHIYDELLKKAKVVYSSDNSGRVDFSSELRPILEKMMEQLSAGNEELLLICLRDYKKSEDPFFCHVANVVIMVIAMGRDLGYEHNKLMDLGVAAFVHDIGQKGLDMLRKPEMFSEEDFQKIKQHPEEGKRILSKIDPGLNRNILDAVLQEHERMDGSGYPKGLVSSEITEYAQIIGLSDVYEALMHDRPYRARYTSIDTIRIILKNKKVFSRKVIKALIETFGIFPIETLVQLNTKEIGVVVKRNAELISRPILDIIIDSYGKEIREPRRINLAENPVIYIDTCVKQEAMM